MFGSELGGAYIQVGGMLEVICGLGSMMVALLIKLTVGVWNHRGLRGLSQWLMFSLPEMWTGSISSMNSGLTPWQLSEYPSRVLQPQLSDYHV